MEYPFNLDDQIINGGRFFDMIRHYIELYERIIDKHTKEYQDNAKSQAIIELVNDSSYAYKDEDNCVHKYEGRDRIGDQYIKSLFLTTVLYYIDRFGWIELEKVIPKIFIWSYSLRLQKQAVQRSSIDDYAYENNSMLRIIFEAKTPYDIINTSLENVKSSAVKATKCEAIIYYFKKLNKYYDENNKA